MKYRIEKEIFKYGNEGDPVEVIYKDLFQRLIDKDIDGFYKERRMRRWSNDTLVQLRKY